jgi:hypothetical protein
MPGALKAQHTIDCTAGPLRNRSEPMIWVEAYFRIRNGELQHVRSHWRRKPKKRKSATLIAFPDTSSA